MSRASCQGFVGTPPFFCFFNRGLQCLRRAKSYLGAFALSQLLAAAESLELPVPADILARSHRLSEVCANLLVIIS